MRDIDFDELDKAVNNYLDKKPEMKKSEKTMEILAEENPAEEKSKKVEMKDERRMVFSRRRVVDAGSFHRGIASSEVEAPSRVSEIEERPVDEPTTEPDFSKLLSENSDKVLSEISSKTDRAIENFIDKNISQYNKENSSIEKADISEKVHVDDAENYSDKRDSFDEVLALNKSDYQAPVLEQIDISPDEIDESEFETSDKDKKDIEAEEKSEIHAEISRDNLVIPTRPGVYKIEENGEMNVFSGSKKSENTKEIQDSPKEDDEESEKINVSIKKFADEPIDDNAPILTEKMIQEKQESSEKTEVAEEKPVKIGINFADSDDLKVDDTQTKESTLDNSSKTDEEIEDAMNILASKPFEKPNKPEKIITQPISSSAKLSAEEIKTPFVANAKIDKRPLGMGAPTGVSNFEMKNDFAKRKKEIRRAKMDNPEPSTPMLARDEYTAPTVHKKKKSGWGAVLAMILVMGLVAAGVGLAVYYFSLNN
ncbi:MAG: hypothetical protein Q4A21_02590 [bacterium]|nr:hypothetical protein [bacterium]